ncbi:transposase (12) BH0978 [Streptococcus agalactiae ILRI005]|nr:transposase (12) BH0978 [Streptococcus agalactiae ILRI005]
MSFKIDYNTQSFVYFYSIHPNITKKSNVSVDKKKLIKAANEAYKLGEIKKDTYESIISGLTNASAAFN